MSTLTSRIDALPQELQSLSQEALQNEEARKKLYGVVQHSAGTLESPMDFIWRMIMTPHQSASLMSIVKAGLLAALVQDKKPKTASELSILTGVEELLIVRLMRPPTALGIIKEVEPRTYTSTPISETLVTIPALLGGFRYMYSAATRSCANLPFYLERTGWKNVSASPPGPFQDAHKTDLTFFGWVHSDPQTLTDFNDFMGGQRATRKDWFDFFPINDILFKGADTSDPSSALLVDVGGGEGHDLQSFQKRYPDHPGRLVLEDLGAVIDNIRGGALDTAIVRVKHDFFKPQPVAGAKAYYLRSIFHDWPDHDCVKIMKNIAQVMKKGYSKMLINDWILPEKNTPLYPALLDINMMALLNAMERTRSQWEALLDQAGLKVVKFHSVADDVEGLVEAELK